MANAGALRERVQTYNQRVFDEGVRLLMLELVEAAPLGETGDTRRGITSTPGGGGVRMTAQVRSESPHGDYVEEGRPFPLDIDLSGTGRVMRFQGGGRRISQPGPNQRISTRAGGVVFTTKIHQEPRPPRPWFRPVVDRWPEFLERAEALAA